MSFNYQDSLIAESLSRYQCKLNLISSKECPYKLPASVWQNNPLKWPDVQWGDVYSYLIDSPGVFTRESMKAFKSLEAHNFFISGWVQTVMHYKPEPSAPTILKADVRPSQRVNDSPHHPWVAVNHDGSIAAAHCDCMAGLSEACSHIGALLFKVEAAVRLGYTKKACTEEPCKWNADFVKKVLPDPISRIKFYKASKVTKAKNRIKRPVKQLPTSTPDQQQQLLQSLHACSSTPVVLSTFQGFSEKFHWQQQTTANPRLPLPLSSLYNSTAITMPIDDLYTQCKNLCNNMTLSTSEITYIYNCTKSQSSSMTWFEQRIGRITSSTVHSMLHTPIENPSQSLIVKICSPTVQTLNTPPILWGRQNEQTALKAYQQVMSTTHQNFQLQKTGFLIDQSYPYVGASADAIATCDCHGKYVVEVKCPYKHRHSILQDFLDDPDCYLYNKNKLHTYHQYYSQVQLQMYVHNTDNCNFVVWAEKFLVVCNVTKDNTFIASMLDHANVFFVNCLLPELLTRKLQTAKTAKSNKNSNDALFCVCQQPDDGDSNMIGCDNNNCKYKWFHLDCINMKKVPKKDWYCKFCRKV